MQYIELNYDFRLNVRHGEVGCQGIASLSSLANWLQEAAGQSASSLGFGEETLVDLGLTWILTRLILRIHRLPASGEAIRVRTWPSALDRFGYRGYEVYDDQGEIIVSGGSAWSIMDLATRKLTPVPQKLAAIYPGTPRPCDAFTGRVLPRLPATTPYHQAPVLVRRDDLDINGHVNNARYLSWLMEPVPLASLSSREKFPPTFSGRGGTAQPVPRLVDLTFRAECFPGDELLSLCALAYSSKADRNTDSTEDDSAVAPLVFGKAVPFRLVHAIRTIQANRAIGETKNTGGEDVCRAITLWTRNPLT